MHVIRSPRPTDLVALATFHGRALPNQAQSRAHLEKGPEGSLNVGNLLEQWVTVENRKSLIAVEGLTVRGVLSARLRGGRSVWEVDKLILDQEESTDLSSALLEHLADRAGRSGVRRIFLRLPIDSPLITAARRAGFLPYTSEVLLQRSAENEVKAPDDLLKARALAKEDEDALFRLYCTTVPAPIQKVEGLTLEEWRETQDPAFGRQKDYLWSREELLWAWLRTIQGDLCNQLQLLVHPAEEHTTNNLVHYALSLLPKGTRTLALVPDYQPHLQGVLAREWGFEEVTHYTSLVRQLTVRVTAGRLVPART